MASTYEYATVSDIEQHMSESLSDIDDKELNETNIEAKISAAEMFINGYVGTSFTGTIPDGVKYATRDITAKMIYRWMLENGMITSKEKIIEIQKPFLTPDIVSLLSMLKKTDSTERSLVIKV